ncbi:hypothetical protein HanRHA438_Chr04g0167441 [Helianthus annuus]|nr:hypothetical protein HanIR_Chr04g0169681 [Helianthus annuus]KAJ0926123.1 hypothetical protein HanRHA438_Chr04g0167441 [Helianthus annuus]
MFIGIQKMDKNRPNVVCCDISSNKVKSRFMWDDITFKEFIDALLVELKRGNRPGTSFNKVG